MSAPLAKFVDHYQVLGVDPKADSEAIHQAYSKLAARYASNGATPDAEKLSELNASYQVLADPSARRAFDMVKSGPEDEKSPTFPIDTFYDGFDLEGTRRAAVLCVLYDRRKKRAGRPALPIRQLEAMLSFTSEEFVFTTWYLRQKGLVNLDDKSSLMISTDGVEFLEALKPSLDQIACMFKPESLERVVRAAAPEPAPEPVVAEPEPPASEQSALESKFGSLHALFSSTSDAPVHAHAQPERKNTVLLRPLKKG